MDTSLLLATVLERLKEEFHLVPVMGLEWEFYLSGQLENKEQFRRRLNAIFANDSMALTLHQERGVCQWEVVTPPVSLTLPQAEKLTFLPDAVRQTALSFGLEASFHPRPRANDYGSSLQFNLHFHDEKEWQREEGQELQRQQFFHSIAGVLALAQDSALAFLPQPEDYARLEPKWHAPTHICWGKNNRTVLIRVPMKHRSLYWEHRLASASADPVLALSMLLYCVLYGLRQGQEPPEPIYGEAFHPQYKLNALPQNREEALHYWQSSQILPALLGKSVFQQLTERLSL
jgi:glutamine synthetase